MLPGSVALVLEDDAELPLIRVYELLGTIRMYGQTDGQEL